MLLGTEGGFRGQRQGRQRQGRCVWVAYGRFMGQERRPGVLREVLAPHDGRGELE